ncbi:MAG: response regulator [Maricaulis sp.]|jgi:CheY-like chemotaxis protein|nr:response regulator [Maricaulis sp.]HAQ36216.1 response regulator [Alphaproteobacteria bacterium]
MTTDPIKVLHVEDDFADALLVQNAVCEAGDLDISFTVARTLREARRKLSGNTFDLILLDLRLPDSVKPHDTFETVKGLSGETPILVLSGSMRVDSDALPEEVTTLDKNKHLTGVDGQAPIFIAGMIRQSAQSNQVEAI